MVVCTRLVLLLEMIVLAPGVQALLLARKGYQDSPEKDLDSGPTLDEEVDMLTLQLMAQKHKLELNKVTIPHIAHGLQIHTCDRRGSRSSHPRYRGGVACTVDSHRHLPRIILSLRTGARRCYIRRSGGDRIPRRGAGRLLT